MKLIHLGLTSTTGKFNFCKLNESNVSLFWKLFPYHRINNTYLIKIYLFIICKVLQIIYNL